MAPLVATPRSGSANWPDRSRARRPGWRRSLGGADPGVARRRGRGHRATKRRPRPVGHHPRFRGGSPSTDPTPWHCVFPDCSIDVRGCDLDHLAHIDLPPAPVIRGTSGRARTGGAITSRPARVPVPIQARAARPEILPAPDGLGTAPATSVAGPRQSHQQCASHVARTDPPISGDLLGRAHSRHTGRLPRPTRCDSSACDRSEDWGPLSVVRGRARQAGVDRRR